MKFVKNDVIKMKDAFNKYYTANIGSKTQLKYFNIYNDLLQKITSNEFESNDKTIIDLREELVLIKKNFNPNLLEYLIALKSSLNKMNI